MTRLDERPWFKFRPDRWLGDADLQSCSLAAQGLWINLISLMHRSDEYGYLVYRGRPAGAKEIARQLPRLGSGEVETLLSELESEGVFSRRESDNCIYCRRMVDDFKKASKCSDASQKSWENRDLRGAKGDLKGDVQHHKSQNQTESQKKKRAPQLCKLPLPFTPRSNERDLAFNELKMNSREFDDSLADFINWASTKGRKSTNPNWDLTFASHLRRDAKSWGTRFRKETPSPFSKPVSRHATAASKPKWPKWFESIAVRFRDSAMNRDWDDNWSKCEPIENAKPGHPVVTLRAHSRSFYTSVTTKRTRDAERFFEVTGYEINLLEPTVARSR